MLPAMLLLASALSLVHGSPLVVRTSDEFSLAVRNPAVDTIWWGLTASTGRPATQLRACTVLHATAMHRAKLKFNMDREDRTLQRSGRRKTIAPACAIGMLQGWHE